MPYTSTPWFWTEQFGAKFQMAGLMNGHDITVIRGNPVDNAFSVFCFHGDTLLGVESVNKPRDHMAARKILGSGTGVTPEQAEDPSVDLKALTT